MSVIGKFIYVLTANGNSVSDFNALNDTPLSFGRTGYYRRSYGNINVRMFDGNWWSNTTSSSTHGRGLDSYAGNNVHAQNTSYRGSGFAIRCVAR